MKTHYFQNIILRINIDRTNHHSIFRLFDDLECVKNDVFLAPRPTNDPHAETRPAWLLSLREFVEFESEFNIQAYERGFRIVVGYPEAGMTSCNAYQSRNSYSVDPYGCVHICPVFTGDQDNRFGWITESGEIVRLPEQEDRESKLACTNYPFSDPDCVSCKALPVCMGGCALFDADNPPLGLGDLRCIAKHNIAEKMYLTRLWDFSADKAEPVC